VEHPTDVRPQESIVPRRPALALGSLLLGPVLVTTAVGAAPATAKPRPGVYALPGTDVFPEGSAVDQSTGTFWISSTTDGTIYRGTVKDPTAEVFLPGGTDGRYDGHRARAGGRRALRRRWRHGQVWAYDAYSGELIFRLDAGVTDGDTFINDVAIAGDGSAWFTDSRNPALYRVSQVDGTWTLEVVDLSDTVIPFAAGFNINGIAASPNGRYLYVVHSATGQLFRVDTQTRDVVEVDLGGVTLTAGDGLEPRGNALYVVRNAFGTVVRVQLTHGGTVGRVVSETADPSFGFPTTAEVLRGRLLVVNSQFDRRGGSPDLPFTVSSVKLP
jgi:sugar lactone lactonase YvrE